MYPCSYTNNPAFVAQHPNMVAMNMSLMVDLSGQIASEGIGHRMISGSGGQLDFMIGSYHSKGGKGITLIYSSRTLKDRDFRFIYRSRAATRDTHYRSKDIRSLRRNRVWNCRPEIQVEKAARRGFDQHRPSRFKTGTAKQSEKELFL